MSMWNENINDINQNKIYFNKIIFDGLKHILCGFIQNERFESQYTHILLIYAQETPIFSHEGKLSGDILCIIFLLYYCHCCVVESCDIMCLRSIGSVLTIYSAWSDMCFNSIGPILTKHCALCGIMSLNNIGSESMLNIMPHVNAEICRSDAN